MIGEFAGFVGLGVLILNLFGWMQRSLAQLEARMNDQFDRNDARFKHFQARVEARFDALGEQLAMHEVRFKEIATRFKKLESRFDQVDSRFEQIKSRLEQVNSRFDSMGSRIDEFERRFFQLVAQTDERLDALGMQFAKLESKLELLFRTIGTNRQDKALATKVS